MFTIQIFNHRNETIYATTEASISRAANYVAAKCDQYDIETPESGVFQECRNIRHRATVTNNPQSFELDTATDGCKSEKSITVTYNAKYND